MGMNKQEIAVLLGEKLDDNIIRYFLSQTNNDVVKARQLAKAFGYKV